MNSTKRLPIAWLLAAATTLAHSAYGVYGVGALECSEFTVDSVKKNDDYYQKLQWLMGYLSSAGYHGRQFNRVAGQEVSKWFESYCKRYPGRSLDQGANEFLYEIEIPKK